MTYTIKTLLSHLSCKTRYHSGFVVCLHIIETIEKVPKVMEAKRSGTTPTNNFDQRSRERKRETEPPSTRTGRIIVIQRR
jgi:hypothetical protein